MNRRLIQILLVIFIIVFAADTNAENAISIIAVGDVMMGSSYPDEMLPPDDGAGIFDGIKEDLKGGDIVFGNLEGPLIDEGKPVKCRDKTSKLCFEFRTPVSYVRHLKDAGFNVMSIANNHSYDFGAEGMRSTIDTLTSEEIQAIGGNTVAYFNVKNKKVALVGFSYKVSPYSYSIIDIIGAMAVVQGLKEENDIVIVSFHGGAEGNGAVEVIDTEEVFAGENRGNVVKFSRAVIDAGADMVIGHGPHVLRKLEVYKGKLIAYSLGNFLTYGRFNIKGPSGLSAILKARIDAESGEVLDYEMVLLKLVNGGLPQKYRGEDNSPPPLSSPVRGEELKMSREGK